MYVDSICSSVYLTFGDLTVKLSISMVLGRPITRCGLLSFASRPKGGWERVSDTRRHRSRRAGDRAEAVEYVTVVVGGTGQFRDG